MKNKKALLIILGIFIILLDQITKAILIGRNITIIPMHMDNKKYIMSIISQL